MDTGDCIRGYSDALNCNQRVVRHLSVGWHLGRLSSRVASNKQASPPNLPTLFEIRCRFVRFRACAHLVAFYFCDSLEDDKRRRLQVLGRKFSCLMPVKSTSRQYPQGRLTSALMPAKTRLILINDTPLVFVHSAPRLPFLCERSGVPCSPIHNILPGD